uniref:Histone-lysine N-methyltransferase, H3 lysine-79 specific n=1 Tax=Globisporangium ultimum (strain ATCC 200006 / CBS 805.95 / DAOM BR144) TaxID=431595 RepID=K3WX18_GLOUD
MTDLNALVAELKRVAPRLHVYEPRDPSWQQAEKIAFSAREQLDVLLSSADGVQQLRSSDALNDMRRLVPEVTRGDISELKVSDFVLGMLFVQPYMTFEDVYRGYGAEYGKELSAEARKSENLIKSSYIYGEILFFPFANAIRWAAPTLPEHAIFYDLGSGTGKAVIAASLLHPFDQAIGIEFLEPLVACANKRKDALVKRGNPFQTDVDFIHGSILTTSWENGDMIFLEWAEISLQAEKLKQGAYFLSTSHVLHSALFEVVKSMSFKMSWGTATLYIHRRRKIGRWAAQMLRGGRATRTDLLQKQQDGKSSKDDEVRE